MDFELSDEQAAVRELIDGVLKVECTPERVAAVLAADGFDRELWATLARAGVFELCLDESWGGNGLDAVELALVAIAQGRYVAPVPLVPSIVAGTVLSRRAPDGIGAELAAAVRTGDAVLTCALAQPGLDDGATPPLRAVSDGDGTRLRGTVPAVPAGQHADWVLVPADAGDGGIVVALVDAAADGVDRTPLTTTAHEPQAELTLDTFVPSDFVLDGADVAAELRLRMLAAQAATMIGVAEGAVAMTATHVSTRTQFDRPLASFQAVSQRAADAYIDAETIRVTALSAAWHLAAGIDARRHVAIAAYWASHAGQLVTHACQHLHGGIGVDIDYPLHRYLLWSTQLGNALGSGSAHLDRLGRLLAEGARA